MLQGAIGPFLDDWAVRLVGDYFHGRLPDDHRTDPGGPLFTGARFDRFPDDGPRTAVDEATDWFTAEDLLAVRMLSVTVPARAAVRLLDTEAGWFHQLLADVPSDVALWEASDEHLGAADRLWRAVEDLHKVGWVTAGKLCARKRPLLVPIYDAVVKDALGPDDMGFWASLRDALAPGGKPGPIVEELAGIRDAAGVGEDISLLRILDVAIWMRNRGILSVPDRYPESEVEPLPSSWAT